VLHFNQTGLRLFDVKSIKEIEGKDITSFLLPDKKDYSLKRIEDALITGSPFYTDEVFQTIDGKHCTST
jgi:hypothetical protein